MKMTGALVKEEHQVEHKNLTDAATHLGEVPKENMSWYYQYRKLELYSTQTYPVLTRRIQ